MTLLHMKAHYWYDIVPLMDLLSLAACCKSNFAQLSPVVSLTLFLLSLSLLNTPFDIEYISSRRKFRHSQEFKYQFYSPVRLCEVRSLEDLPISVQQIHFHSSM